MAELIHKVQDCQQISSDLFTFSLSPVEIGRTLAFQAGQYVWLNPAGAPSSRLPFTIASAPQQDGSLRFILRMDYSVQGVDAFVAALKARMNFIVSAAEGHCVLSEGSQRPLLLIAGGTGLSQAMALLESLQQQAFAYPCHLYISVRQLSDAVLVESLPSLTEGMKNFAYHLCLSRPDSAWQGPQGYAYEQIGEDFSDLSEYAVYISGPYAMVHDTIVKLLPKGLCLGQVYTDMLDVTEIQP